MERFPKSVRPGTGIKGMDIVLRNLNRELKKIKGGSMKGLIQSSIIVRRSMDKTPPLIPIDTGNLRASYFTVVGGMGAGMHKQSTPAFKGDKASEMAADHSSAISSAKALAQAASARGPMLMMGFSANYAMFAHENVGAQFFGRPGKKPGRPGSGAKFFEASLKRNKALILETIRINAQIR